MGKQRRKFEVGFKQQIVNEVVLGALSLSAAARKYEISPSVIARRCEKSAHGALQAGPSAREKALEPREPRSQGKARRALSTGASAKKMEDYARRQKNADSCVITAQNSAALQRGAK